MNKAFTDELNDVLLRGRRGMTPQDSGSGLGHIKQRLLEQLTARDAGTEERLTSPGLERLRATPVGVFRERQRILSQKHEMVRQQSASLSVGGGVSMWPGMDNMKLSRQEMGHLSIVCSVLFVAAYALFFMLHGSLLDNLHYFTERVVQFPADHPINLVSAFQLRTTTLHWHTEFSQILLDIHTTFDVSRPPLSYQMYILVYLLGLCVLVYYLIDNMSSKSKLSPQRIKTWVSLLVVIGTWTILLMTLLSKAHRLEAAVERVIHQFGDVLADAVHTDIDRSHYNSILSYWSRRCLPPTTPGTLSIVGVVALRDIVYYLQYYSLPLLTVLLTPIVRLIMALRTVYVPH